MRRGRVFHVHNNILLGQMRVERDGSLPRDTKLQLRVVFSHYNHPLKQYSRKIGRYWSMQADEASRVLKSEGKEGGEP